MPHPTDSVDFRELKHADVVLRSVISEINILEREKAALRAVTSDLHQTRNVCF